MRCSRLMLAMLVLGCGVALAVPAPWYLWSSRISDYRACSQSSPGAGWQRLAGPFRDGRCRLPGMP